VTRINGRIYANSGNRRLWVLKTLRNQFGCLNFEVPTKETYYNQQRHTTKHYGNSIELRNANSSFYARLDEIHRKWKVCPDEIGQQSSERVSNSNNEPNSNQQQQQTTRTSPNQPKKRNQDRASVSEQSRKIPLKRSELYHWMKDVEKMNEMKESSDIEDKIQEMIYRGNRDGISPINVVIYNILLKSYIRENRFQDAKNLIPYMIAGPYYASPDQHTYNTLIKGYVRKRNIDEALKIKDEMLGMHIFPDTATYNTLFDGIAKTKPRMNLILSEKLKEEMESFRVVPNETTYHSLILIYAICNKREKIITAIRDMKHRGIEFTDQKWLSHPFTTTFKEIFSEADNPIRELLSKRKQNVQNSKHQEGRL